MEKIYRVPLFVCAAITLAGCASDGQIETVTAEPAPSEIPEEAVYRYGVEVVNPGRVGAALGLPSEQHVLHFAEFYTVGLAAAQSSDMTNASEKDSVEVTEPDEAPANPASSARTTPLPPSQSGDQFTAEPSGEKATGIDSSLEGNPGLTHYETTGTRPPK